MWFRDPKARQKSILMPSVRSAAMKIAFLLGSVSAFSANSVQWHHHRHPVSRSPYKSTATTQLLRVTSISQENQNENASSNNQQDDPEDDRQRQRQEMVQKSYCVTGIAPRTGPLNEAVARVLKLESFEQANELIAIGAVWARMDALSEEDILRQYDGNFESNNARALYADINNRKQGTYDDYYTENYEEKDDEDADLEAYVEQIQNQRYRRVLTPVMIEAGTDLRIYPSPRRFPACAEFAEPADEEGRSRLIYEDTTFIVVDKPPMLPTQPDASNYYECCPGCVNDHLGPFQDIQGNTIARPLLCHRVDACVGGCVVLSKDVNGQKVFQEFQRDRKLRKMYLAVTKEPVPLGMHLHWMWAPQNQRGKRGGPPCQLVSHTPPESRFKARVR